LREYGEERWASRVAAFIVGARGDRPIETTGQLVSIIKAAIPAAARRSGGHPARRTFQALRIEVNDELGVLERGLRSAIRWLAPGGRIAVISYHSSKTDRGRLRRSAKGCVCPPDMLLCSCGGKPVLRKWH
jgi:16S rRNA (cytosine1402-N4)-methyltransferase